MPSLALTPRGRLLFAAARDDEAPTAFWRGVQDAFERGSGHGLLELGARDVDAALPPDFSYWRDFTAQLITTICTQPDLQPESPLPSPDADALDAFAAAAPPMEGAEYLTADV